MVNWPTGLLYDPILTIELLGALEQVGLLYACKLGSLISTESVGLKMLSLDMLSFLKEIVFL